jgi:hypothetical protein
MKRNSRRKVRRGIAAQTRNEYFAVEKTSHDYL